jgi:hypothetical protein
MVDKENKSSIKDKNYFIKLISSHLEQNKLYNFKIKEFNWANLSNFNTWLSLFEFLKLEEFTKERLHDMIEELKAKINLEKNSFKRRDQYIWFFKYQIVPMLVNKNSEGYEEIVKELFEKIFSAATKPKETNPNKYNLILLLALFSVSFYYFTAGVYWEQAINESVKPIKTSMKSKRTEKKGDDEDSQKPVEDGYYESDWSDNQYERFYNYIVEIRKTLKNSLPDFHEMRAILKIFTALTINFSGLHKDVTNWIKNDMVVLGEFVANNCSAFNKMSLFEKKKIQDDEEEDEEECQGEEENEIFKKWSKETLSSEETKTALSKLVILDLQKMVIENIVDFKTERTLEMETYDIDVDDTNEEEDDI